MFDAMVTKGKLGPEAFAQITATAPADIYGLSQKGAIAADKDADLVIWDPDKQVTYDENDLHDNVGYNPWVGRTITGWPVHVIQRGRTIMQDGVFQGTAGGGNWIDRPVLATQPKGAV